MSSQGATHPYIGFLVGVMKDISILLDSGQPGIALKDMYKILHSVEEGARNKENWKNLHKETYGAITARRRVRDSDPVVLRSKLDSFDYTYEDGYFDLWSKLWLILWDNGYMHEKTFFEGLKQDPVKL